MPHGTTTHSPKLRTAQSTAQHSVDVQPQQHRGMAWSVSVWKQHTGLHHRQQDVTTRPGWDSNAERLWQLPSHPAPPAQRPCRMPHNATMRPGGRASPKQPPTPFSSPAPTICPTLDVQDKQTNRTAEGTCEATSASVVPQLRLQQHTNTHPNAKHFSLQPSHSHRDATRGAWWWGQHTPPKQSGQYAGWKMRRDGDPLSMQHTGYVTQNTPRTKPDAAPCVMLLVGVEGPHTHMTNGHKHRHPCHACTLPPKAQGGVCAASKGAGCVMLMPHQSLQGGGWWGTVLICRDLPKESTCLEEGDEQPITLQSSQRGTCCPHTPDLHNAVRLTLPQPLAATTWQH